MAKVVFTGTVMRGQPAHDNLNGARFIEEVRTAARYRLFSVNDLYPAMVWDEKDGRSIAGEMYDVPDDVWPRIRDGEPPGVYRAAIKLESGEFVEGMISDKDFVEKQEATDITSFGGWVEYLAAKGDGWRRGASLE